MRTNAFIGKKARPTGAELAAALGPAQATWDKLLSDLAQEHGVNVLEWKCSSPKWGWSLRVKRKARTIVWLAPSAGRFTVLFILGDKAMRAARQTKLPRRVTQAMDKAPKYPEGTGLRFEVKSPGILGALKTLAAIKIAN